MKIFFVCFVLLSTLALPVAQAQEVGVGQGSTDVSQMIQILLAKIAVLQEQLARQTASMASSTVSTLDQQISPDDVGVVSDWQYDRSQYDLFADSEIREDLLTDDYDVKTYLVRNDLLYEDYKWTKNKSTDSYRIWRIYAHILGYDWVAENIRQYNTYRDPEGALYGFVWRMRKEDPSWGFAVDISRSDFDNSEWVRDMIIVMLHETAHIATLNNKQILPKIKKSKYCLERDGFYTGTECAKEGSYLQEFGFKFWNDYEFVTFYNEAQKLAGKERGEKLQEYYEEHSDRFVTAYSLKSPEEDIAESFVNFVLEDKPTSQTVRDQKVAFFYNYPELVKRREEIREEIEQYFILSDGE